MGKLIDLTGRTFGRLRVIHRTERGDNRGEAVWLCRCECGAEKPIQGTTLSRGKAKSCGCLHRENAVQRMTGNTICLGRKMAPEAVQKSVASRTKNSARCKAIKEGTTFYSTGKPCKHGHTASRRTADGNCVECSKDKNRSNRPQKLFMAARTRAKRGGLPFSITADDVRAVWPQDNCCPIMQIPFQSDRRGEVSKRHGATLDKLDPKLGYVKGNIAVISWQANVIKQDCTDPAIFRRIADWLSTHLRATDYIPSA